MTRVGAVPACQYRGWLVDFDGTLYRALGVRMAMAGELLLGHWRAMAILRRFRHEQELLRTQTDIYSHCPYRLQIERTAQRVNKTAAEIEFLVSEWMHHRPGRWTRAFRRRSLLEEIRQFHATGGRTALVSDYPASVKLDAMAIRHLFDAVVASGEPGGPRRLKPDPEGFQIAAAQLGLSPHECLVIGDREDADGVAAARAGMAFRLVR